MAAGVPAIVFNVGAFSELPSDAVVKIDHDEHADDLLTAYLRRLIEDESLRERIGENAHRYLVEHHDIETSASRYLDFIRQVIALRPRKQFLRNVADEISALGIGERDDALLRGVAMEVAALGVESSGAGSGQVALRTQTASLPSAPQDGDMMSPLPAIDHPQAGMPAPPGLDYKHAAIEYPGCSLTPNAATICARSLSTTRA